MIKKKQSIANFIFNVLKGLKIFSKMSITAVCDINVKLVTTLMTTLIKNVDNCHYQIYNKITVYSN